MVKFGIYLPTFSREIISRKLYEFNLEVAREAERNGLDWLWSVDHLHAFDAIEQVGRSLDILESTTLISALAAVTNLGVGFCVLCLPFRNPALTAKIAASIDIISNGKFILGVGAGWRKEEFLGYGYGWSKFGERLEKTKESIEIIKLMWREPIVSYNGKYFNLQGGELWPKPLQKPHPPIWFGGVGPKALTLMKYVDGWLAPPLHPEDFSERLDYITELRGGEKPQLGYEFYTAIDENMEKAIEKSKPSLERWFGRSIESIMTFETGVKLPGGIRVRYGATVGDPEKCIERLSDFIKRGVEHFILHFMPLEDTINGIKFYGKYVIPYIRDEFRDLHEE